MADTHAHDGYITVDRHGVGVMHDTLLEAIEAAEDDPELGVYWAERTPVPFLT